MHQRAGRPIVQGATCDVVVIGGGPAGSAAALRLARAGWHVIQLERRYYHAPGCARWRSGEGLPPAAQQALAQLGLDALDCWTTNTIRRLMLRWPSGRVTHNRFSANRTITMVERESLDAALFAAARAMGVDGRLGWSVRQLLQNAAGAFHGVLATDPAGATTHISARLVIDAGGRNARSLTQLGLGQPLAGPQFLVVTLLMDRLPDADPDRWEMHLFGSPLHVLQIVSLAPGVVGCGLGALLRCRASGQRPESFFWDRVSQDDRLRQRLRQARQIERPWTRARLAYRVQPLVLPGLMLIGDATGYVSPLLGDGVWGALRSAEIAADVASHALRMDDVSDARLMEYSRRWTLARRARTLINRMLMRSVAYPRLLEAGAAWSMTRRLFLHGLLAE